MPEQIPLQNFSGGVSTTKGNKQHVPLPREKLVIKGCAWKGHALIADMIGVKNKSESDPGGGRGPLPVSGGGGRGG